MAFGTTNIDMNTLHIAVGGTSGTTVALNDADIRSHGANYYYGTTYGAPTSTTGASTISLGEFRTQANTRDNSTVTVGSFSYSDKGGSTNIYGYYAGTSSTGDSTTYYPSSAVGSRSPTNLTVNGTNYTIIALCYDTGYVRLSVSDSGANFVCFGLTIGSVTYTSSDLSSAVQSGGVSTAYFGPVNANSSGFGTTTNANISCVAYC